MSSHLYFYVFAIELTKCKSQNEKEIIELQKPVAHTRIRLGKRESNFCIEMYGAQKAKG